MLTMMEKLLSMVPQRRQPTQQQNAGIGQLLAFLNQGGAPQINLPPVQPDNSWLQFTRQNPVDTEAQYAKDAADHADEIFGTQGSRVPTPLLDAGQMTPGSGLLSMANPQDMPNLLTSKAMLKTGNPILVKQALADLRQSFKPEQSNITFDQYMSMPPDQREAFDKYKGHGPTTMVSIGDKLANLQERLITPDQVNTMGLAPDKKYYIDKNGDVKTLPTKSDTIRPATIEEKSAYGYDPSLPATYSNQTGEVRVTPSSATEDQAKSAMYLGGLIRAKQNLVSALSNTNLDPAEEPGNYAGSVLTDMGIPVVKDIGTMMKTSSRQLFDQAAAETKVNLIHALTGAGFSTEEAATKAAVVIPIWGEGIDTRQRKLSSIDGYIQDLTARAGPAVFNKKRLTDAVKQVESGGSSDIQLKAYTPARNGEYAQGPMQIKPSTAANPGYGMEPINLNSTTPEQHQEWAGRLIQSIADKDFGGDMRLALESYRHGPATIKNNGNKPPNNDWSYSNSVLKQIQPVKKQQFIVGDVVNIPGGIKLRYIGGDKKWEELK